MSTNNTHTVGPVRILTGCFLAGLALLFFVFYCGPLLFNLDDSGMLALLTSPWFGALALVALIIAPIVLLIHFKRQGQLHILDGITTGWVSYVNGFLLFYYGFAKIIHKFFDITYLTQDTKAGMVDSFALTWFYFGRSNAQEMLIGFMELIPAVLLFPRRTRMLGVLLLLPVTGNVFLTNVFNSVSGLTRWVAPFAFFSLLYILAPHLRSLLGHVQRMLPPATPLEAPLRQVARSAKIVVLLTVVVFVATSMYYTIFPPSRSANANKFLGGFELASLQVNGSAVDHTTDSTRYYKSIFLEPQMRWNSVSFDADHRTNRYLTVRWSATNDSVTTLLKLDRSVEVDSTDAGSLFQGTYRLVGDQLFVDGMQYRDTIKATYHKKPLKDYTWFW